MYIYEKFKKHTTFEEKIKYSNKLLRLSAQHSNPETVATIIDILNNLYDNAPNTLNLDMYSEKNTFTATALEFAFYNEKHRNQIMDLLKRNGATYNIALYHTSDIPFLNYLLKQDVGINTQLSDGSTRIHLACLDNNEAVVELLLKNKCDYRKRNNNGLSGEQLTTDPEIRALLTSSHMENV